MDNLRLFSAPLQLDSIAQHAALHDTADRMTSLLANFQFDHNVSYTAAASGAAVQVHPNPHPNPHPNLRASPNLNPNPIAFSFTCSSFD